MITSLRRSLTSSHTRINQKEKIIPKKNERKTGWTRRDNHFIFTFICSGLNSWQINRLRPDTMHWIENKFIVERRASKVTHHHRPQHATHTHFLPIDLIRLLQSHHSIVSVTRCRYYYCLSSLRRREDENWSTKHSDSRFHSVFFGFFPKSILKSIIL